MFSILHQQVRKLLGYLSDTIPAPCVLCHAHSQNGLCPGCCEFYFSRQINRCHQCGNPLASPQTHLPCGTCQKHPPHFDAAIVVTDYAPPVDQLVQAFKFKAHLALAPLFANLLYQVISTPCYAGFPRPDFLTAVPLGTARLSERGFNQALEIAKPLSRHLNIPLKPSLAIKINETGMQSTTPLKMRKKNIRKAFMVSEKDKAFIQGKHIGIIDDVLTTGATLDELANTFKRAGATRVTGFIFARTPP